MPAREPGEALVRVRVAGVCNTDLEIVRGYKGFHGILGHEFVGEVAESPDSPWVGRRVCGEINVGCGTCHRCLAGTPGHCSRRRVLGILGKDGSFAEYLTLPPANLHQVPDSLPDEEAVFVEPLAAAFEILEQVQVRAGDKVAILGDGKLGLLCAQVVALTGADVIAIGRHPEKLAILAERGIQTALVDEPGGSEPDIVVEATGSMQGLAMALGLVKPRGTLVLKSTLAEQSGVDLSPIVVNEVTVVGSRCGPFARAIQALTDRVVDVRSLVEERYPLERGVEAMSHTARPGSLKILLDVGTDRAQ